MAAIDLLLPGIGRLLRGRQLALTSDPLPEKTFPAPSERHVRVDVSSGSPSVGNEIEAGAEIGKLAGIPVLAPFKCKVTAAEPIRFLLGDGAGLAVTVEQDAEEKGGPAALEPLDESASREELLDRFRQLGLAAFGRNALPLAELLSGDLGGVLVSAADLEPLLSSEASLLRKGTKEISHALDIIRRAAGMSDIVFAVPESMRTIGEQALGESQKLLPLASEYPKTLPELAARSAFGATVSAPIAVVTLETALAAAVAADKGLPTLTRTLTVIGADRKHRHNVTVEIGTPLEAVLEAVGYQVGDGDRLLCGGAMRGRAEAASSASVDAFTTAIMVIGDDEGEPLDNDPCIGCGACIEV